MPAASPIVLNATPGDPAANTYALLTEAETYHATRGFNSKWTSATDGAKNIVLAWATKLLDQQVWKGVKAIKTGALRWPQIGQVDRDFLIVDGTSIPQFLKEACAEWAFYLLVEDRTADEGGLVQYGGKVGPVFDPAMYIRKTMPESVRDIIYPYLLNGSETYAPLRRM